MKVLVIGAGGMLGSTLFRYFSQDPGIDAVGTVRSESCPVKETGGSLILTGIDAMNSSGIKEILRIHEPDFVINCVGIIKQLKEAKESLVSIQINSLLPHLLSQYCRESNARLVHFSTDCVFSGRAGNYKEDDFADADDLYGRSKYLGEVIDCPSTITLRTSIIGHELSGGKSLLNWFLSQEGKIEGFTKAIFSGLPTVEVARVLSRLIQEKPTLHGLYHLSVDPISKYDLLAIINDVYGKGLDIAEASELSIDRALDSSRLRSELGYDPPPWEKLIESMHDFG